VSGACNLSLQPGRAADPVPSSRFLVILFGEITRTERIHYEREPESRFKLGFLSRIRREKANEIMIFAPKKLTQNEA
jgi:hypothetical protein